MLRFLARRFLWFVITVSTVMTVSFFLMHSVKGGPFDGERKLDPVIEANIKELLRSPSAGAASWC